MLGRLLGPLNKLGRRSFRPTQEELFEKYGIDKKQSDFSDFVSKHLSVISLSPTMKPESQGSFIAPSATVAGNVDIFAGTSIWYGAVVKADVNLIRIGMDTNIQDNTIVTECLRPLGLNHDGSTIIGHNVTIGHSCLLKGCTIEDFSYIGMGSVLDEGSYVEDHAIIGAGSYLPPHTRVPSAQVWHGSPARFIRNLTDDELRMVEQSPENYLKLSEEHRDTFDISPSMDLYVEAEKLGYPVGWDDKDFELEKLEIPTSSSQ